MSETSPTAEPERNAKAEAAAAKAYAKAQRPWFKKKRFILPLAFVAIMIVAGVSGGGDDTKTVATDTGSDPSASVSAPADEAAEESSAPVVDDESVEPVVEEPDYTASQENAIEAAQNYLSFAPFSRLGLIQQLSSKAGDGYPRADAVFAVNHIDVNYNKQAVKAAKNYLSFTSFSRAGLIQQLSSKAGDKYTQAQAVYAANALGL